jgi:hypothetical protein
MASATKATKVFAGLRCVHCGEADCLVVKLDELSIECQSCSETIEKGEVEAIIAKWQGLWNWIAAAAMFADPK